MIDIEPETYRLSSLRWTEQDYTIRHVIGANAVIAYVKI